MKGTVGKWAAIIAILVIPLMAAQSCSHNPVQSLASHGYGPHYNLAPAAVRVAKQEAPTLVCTMLLKAPVNEALHGVCSVVVRAGYTGLRMDVYAAHHRKELLQEVGQSATGDSNTVRKVSNTVVGKSLTIDRVVYRVGHDIYGCFVRPIPFAILGAPASAILTIAAFIRGKPALVTAGWLKDASSECTKI